MTIFGLTGGIASGKSFVAGLLAERGALVLDADRHAHAVLGEPAVRRAVVDRWGESLVTRDGSLRRSEIARRVFGEGEAVNTEREFLEGLVHPRVRERLQGELAEAKSQGIPAVVLDIPLLLKAGWADQCDVVLFVDTPAPIRQQRAAARGWSAEDLARREAAQTPIAEKRRRADAVVPGADEAALRAAIAPIWDRFVGGGSP